MYGPVAGPAEAVEANMAQRVTAVDEYLAGLPDEAREVMAELRRTVLAVVPDAGERISYGMPTFTLDGRSLVHLAAWKRHAGLYPLPRLDPDLEREVAPYRGAKDAMQLRYDRPVPYDLVGRVVAVLADRCAGQRLP
jgi:uncharacterized protein YdhG (YjbR/CyaY superfamily)